MTAGDFYGDGRNEVAYIRDDVTNVTSLGTIFVHDFSDGQSRRVPCALADKLIAADLDGNGRDELVFIDAYSKYVRSYDFVTKSFSILAGSAKYQDLSAGDVDVNNDGDELLLSRTDDGFIRYYNGSVQYPHPNTWGHRMVRGDFDPDRPGDEFAMRGDEDFGNLYYFEPGKKPETVGGSVEYLAAGNIDVTHPGDEVLLNNNKNELWVHNYTAGWANPLENGTAPGIGRLDDDLSDGQELGYVIGTDKQIRQSDPGNPLLAYLLLRQDGSDTGTGSAAANGNTGWGDMLVADVDGDGLEELITRKSATLDAPDAPDALYRFDNGTAGFSLATPSSNLLLIPIADPSFENTVVGDEANNVAQTPWSDSSRSIFDPGNDKFAGTTGDGANTQGVLPDGGQVAATQDSSTLSQDLGVQVQPNTKYTFSFWVGNRDDAKDTDYKVELLAGGTPMATWNNPRIPEEDAGTFENATVVYTTGDSVADGELGIRFSGMENFGSSQTFFDLVELEAQAGWREVAILDSSFEDTVVRNGYNDVAPDPADSWTETGWDPDRDYHSIFDPDDAQFIGTHGDGENANTVLPDGGQVGMVKGGTTLWQDLGPVLSDGEYTLSFWVGDRFDSYNTGYMVELFVELAETETIIISEENPHTPVNGRFELVTLSGLVPLGASGDLRLRFTGISGQTFFDEVELFVTGGQSSSSSPEPSTVALLGIGAAGLLFGARRRRVR